MYLYRFVHCIWNFRMSDVVKINLHRYWICFLWKWGKTKKCCYYLCKFITVLCDQIAWFRLYGIVIHYIRVWYDYNLFWYKSFSNIEEFGIRVLIKYYDWIFSANSFIKIKIKLKTFFLCHCRSLLGMHVVFINWFCNYLC